MRYSLQELAKHLNALLNGIDKGSIEVSGVAAPERAGSEHLIFVEGEKRLAEALASKAGAILTTQAAATLMAATGASSRPLLIHKHPRLAFARAAAMLADPQPRAIGAHPTAIVDGSAKLGLGSSVGPHAVIEKSASIGARTHIGANSRIGAEVVIGADCVLEANVCVYPGARLGDRVIVHSGAVLGSDGFGFVPDPATGKYEKFPQIGALEIGDDVEIGANCAIDRGALATTIIGRGTKLDNMVHVGHNVRIGENVVIAAQTGISGSSTIGDGCVIGGQVGIADHVTVEDGAILGAQCGVPTGKVIRGKGVVYWGTPARPLKQVLKELAAVSRAAKKKE